MGTVSNKGTITAIEGVLIETIDGQIRISTYDMTKGVRSTFDAIEIEREGKFIINAQRLYQTVRVMPEDEVTIVCWVWARTKTSRKNSSRAASK